MEKKPLKTDRIVEINEITGKCLFNPKRINIFHEARPVDNVH